MFGGIDAGLRDGRLQILNPIVGKAMSFAILAAVLLATFS